MVNHFNQDKSHANKPIQHKFEFLSEFIDTKIYQSEKQGQRNSNRLEREMLEEWAEDNWDIVNVLISLKTHKDKQQFKLIAENYYKSFIIIDTLDIMIESGITSSEEASMAINAVEEYNNNPSRRERHQIAVQTFGKQHYYTKIIDVFVQYLHSDLHVPLQEFINSKKTWLFSMQFR